MNLTEVAVDCFQRLDLRWRYRRKAFLEELHFYCYLVNILC